MSRSDFGVAVIPAMAGFFSFGKKSKVQGIQKDKPKNLPAVVNVEAGGITGVAKYLMVVPLVTGVAKYIKKKDKQPMSSVEKYVLRQAVAERYAPAPTGVTKYLAKAAKEAPARKKSGVDCYIAKQELAFKSPVALTGVAKYEAEQNLIAKKLAMSAMVEKYRLREEESARLAKEAAVAAFEASRRTVEHSSEAEPEAATRVGRYLQSQAKLSKRTPKVTGVARYVAKKIVLDSEKPVVSKVAKYMQQQEIISKQQAKLTGVARYLSSQHKGSSAVTVTKKEKLIVSGVAKYLANQSDTGSQRTVLSGVAKYLEQQTKLLGNEDNVLRLTNALDLEPVEIIESLEGEFIPAKEFVALTGVAKYLSNKESVVVDISKETSKGEATGVSRYLEKQVVSVKQALPSSSVDRYLLKKAS